MPELGDIVCKEVRIKVRRPKTLFKKRLGLGRLIEKLKASVKRYKKNKVPQKIRWQNVTLGIEQVM
jgi:hypothetical protein